MFAHPFWGCGRFWALLACSHYINHSIEGVRAHLAPFPLSKISPADWDATHDTINSLGPGHYWIVRTQHPGFIPVPNPAAGPNDDQFVKYPAALVATHLVPSCYRPTADSDKWWYVYHPKTLISTKVFLVDPLPASNSHVAPNSDPPLKSHSPLSSSQRLPPKATAISKLRADAPPFYPSVQKTSELRGKEACEEIALTKNGNEHSEKPAPPIATELPNFPPSSGVTGAMLSQTHTPASLAPLLSRTGSAAGPSTVNTNAEVHKSLALETPRGSSRKVSHFKGVHPQEISTQEVNNKPPLDQILTKTGNPHGASQNEGIPDSVSGEEVYSVTEKLKQDEAFNQAPRYDSPSAITPNEEKSANVGTVSGAQESAHTSTLDAPESMERIHKEAGTVGCLYPVQPEDSKRTRQKGKSRYHKQPTRSKVKQTTNPQSNQDRFVQTESLKTKVSDVSVDAITQNHTSLPLKTPPASELLDKSEGPGKDIELNKASFKTHDLNLEDAKSKGIDLNTTSDPNHHNQASYLSALQSQQKWRMLDTESSHLIKPSATENLHKEVVILESDKGARAIYNSQSSPSTSGQAGYSLEKMTPIDKHKNLKLVIGKQNEKTTTNQEGECLALKGKSLIPLASKKKQRKKLRRENQNNSASNPQEEIPSTREQKNTNKLTLCKGEGIPIPSEEGVPNMDKDIYSKISLLLQTLKHNVKSIDNYSTSSKILLSENFQFVFRPRSALLGDEIYPGIKSKTGIKFGFEIISNKKLKNKNIETANKKGINFNVGLNKSLRANKRLFTKETKEQNIDWNYIELLSIHLRIDDSSAHLPLVDMDLETYMQLRDMWKRDSKKFIALKLSFVGVIGIPEGLRRIKTMLKQAYEHTVVENWKAIKEVLIKQGELTDQEAKDIEESYKLSERFPKRIYTQKKDDLNQPKLRIELLVEILSSLGVFKSKRHERFPIESFISHNPLLNANCHASVDLESRIVTNGLEPRKLINALEIYKDTKFEKDPSKLAIQLSRLAGPYELILWENSAENQWILEPLGYNTPS
ncbi:hypothetical protein Pst134EA_019195 [Puccinia striiformis f. sp. tritici]|nr:hypothetical protein Pst134EA_019195 [Puccinia striiformis f. sp. tritici]KAH9459045.1 hypothetical protein Pst134EA_019195 [Puccinia striiformis f. sp. tritici]